MTAATQNRNTPRRDGTSRGYLVAAGVHALAGTLAVLNESGFCEPATTAADLTCVGVFGHEVDNTNGADGAEVVEVERGYFCFANSAGADEITLADVGTMCELVDDQTVAKAEPTSGRSPAGIVDDVDDSGVWVFIDPTSGVLL